MKKIAEFIVRNRGFIVLLFIIFIIYSVISIPKVNIEYSISAYLPDSSDTTRALVIMDEEFESIGSMQVMLRNVTFERADALKDEIVKIKGVKSLPFENTESYYKQSCALFTIVFNGTGDDAETASAYATVKELLADYDALETASPSTDFSGALAREMLIVLCLAVVVIGAVLLFTSKSYAEVLAFPLVFGTAAVINMGTNYWFGTISFVSNSVCIILQLALSIDYSIILLHRFIEEKENHPLFTNEANMAEALSKAIPEISGSCLTTISGLLALACMTFKLGADLGFVLTKSIVCSILTVLLLMPAILLKLSKAIDKTRHRSFVPKIDKLGKFVVRSRFVLPIVFVLVIVVSAYGSFNLSYCYDMNAMKGFTQTDRQVAIEETGEVFGFSNMFVVLVPKDDYDAQRKIIDCVKQKPLVTSSIGIVNIEIKDGICLCDNITYRQCANLLGISNDLAKNIFYLYAVEHNNLSVAVNNNIDKYTIMTLDLFDFVFELIDKDYVTLDDEARAQLDDARELLDEGKKQLIGANYTRLVFNLAAKSESKEAFGLISELYDEVHGICPDAIFAGDSMIYYDFSASFEKDNMLISCLTALFVYIVLMFTFGSWGVPLLLVSVIQGAIFINYAIPWMMGFNVYFFVYLIGCAIQMGATIDYAILITNRYLALRKVYDKKRAAIFTLNQAFPTIITSGTIMTLAALFIGLISTNSLISGMGMTICRGTIVSIICVMVVLPQLLMFFDGVIDRTFFSPKLKNAIVANISEITGRARSLGKYSFKIEKKAVSASSPDDNSAKESQSPEPNANEVEPNGCAEEQADDKTDQ